MTVDLACAENAVVEATEGDHERERFDWGALVALIVHPLKVGIIEALHWLGHPLSAAELGELLADAHYSSDLVGYHAAGLVKLGVLEVTDTRRIRGVFRHYYYLSERPSNS